MVYKRMTRSGMCKLSQQWEMLYLQCSNGDKSDVFFCPFTVQHILYLCNFPAQITLLVGLSNILDSKGREDISGSSPVKRTHGAGVAATLVGS